MVYSKFEMPHHYINSGIDEPSHRGVHRRISSSQKIPDDVSACQFLLILLSLYNLLSERKTGNNNSFMKKATYTLALSCNLHSLLILQLSVLSFIGGALHK